MIEEVKKLLERYFVEQLGEGASQDIAEEIYQLLEKQIRWEVGEELCCLVGNLMLGDTEKGKLLGSQLSEYINNYLKKAPKSKDNPEGKISPYALPSQAYDEYFTPPEPKPDRLLTKERRRKIINSINLDASVVEINMAMLEEQQKLTASIVYKQGYEDGYNKAKGEMRNAKSRSRETERTSETYTRGDR